MNRKALEVSEKLEAMGQENEKEGIRYTKEFMDEFDKREWERNQLQIQKLEHRRKFKKMDYFHLVARMLDEESKQLDISDRFLVKTIWNEEKTGLMLYDMLTKKQYGHGFKISGIPKIDHAAVTVLLLELQNTAEAIEQEQIKDSNKTRSGIIVS